MDTQASYTHENIAELAINLLSGVSGKGIRMEGLSFSHDCLLDKKISHATFRNCYFSTSSLDLAELTTTDFIGCTFAQLRLADTSKFSDVTFRDCTVDSLVLPAQGRDIWSPTEIRQQLEEAGIRFQDAAPPAAPQPAWEPDAEVVDLEKLIRYFMRSTHMSESVIRMKLSTRGQGFLDKTLPRLLKSGVFVEIQNFGASDQRRFRLGPNLQSINDAVLAANGNFEGFLAQFQ